MSDIVLNDQIIANSSVCHGQPTFKGTRIMVWQVLEELQDGASFDDIIASYPSLSRGAISAALQYAADKIRGVSYEPYKVQSFSPRISA